MASPKVDLLKGIAGFYGSSVSSIDFYLLSPTITVGGIELKGREGWNWSQIVNSNSDKLEIKGYNIYLKGTSMMLYNSNTWSEISYGDNYNSSIPYSWENLE